MSLYFNPIDPPPRKISVIYHSRILALNCPTNIARYNKRRKKLNLKYVFLFFYDFQLHRTMFTHMSYLIILFVNASFYCRRRRRRCPLYECVRKLAHIFRKGFSDFKLKLLPSDCQRPAHILTTQQPNETHTQFN